MKNSITVMAAALALLASPGCRLEDKRDFEVNVPALAQGGEGAVMNAVRQALAGCEGVEAASIQFDSPNGRVKLRYDSMKTAKTNILFALAKVGLESFVVIERDGGVVTNRVKPEHAAYVTNAAAGARQ